MELILKSYNCSKFRDQQSMCAAFNYCVCNTTSILKTWGKWWKWGLKIIRAGGPGHLLRVSFPREEEEDDDHGKNQKEEEESKWG